MKYTTSIVILCVVVVGTCNASTAPCSLVDFDQSGTVDADDLSAYLACYFGQPCAAADVDGNSVVDADDLAEFIGAYFDAAENGCADSLGPVAPSAANDGGGTAAFTSPSAALALDGIGASCSLVSSAGSGGLVLSGFSLDVPDSATAVTLTLRIVGRSSTHAGSVAVELVDAAETRALVFTASAMPFGSGFTEAVMTADLSAGTLSVADLRGAGTKIVVLWFSDGAGPITDTLSIDAATLTADFVRH